jgi:hypothetical protein
MRVLDLAVKRGLLDHVSAREVNFKIADAKRRGENVSVAEHLVKAGLITQFQADELAAPEKPAAAEPKKALGRGDVIGGFRVMDMIGEGAMGAVYRAVQVNLDRTVALKILPERFAGSKTFLDRFLREAKVAARLEHPNVVRAIDAGEREGRYYFAMELVEGRSLERILQDLTYLTEEQAVDLAVQATRGLVCAWKNGLIHRDIKPENILVTHDGVVKIADLGLAKSVEAPSDARLTQEGIAVGTPHYISPEQAQALDVDIRTDIYALGIMLYRAVSGVLPFDDTDAVRVVAMRLHRDPLPVRQVNENVSRNLEMVIETMTARNRDDRYPDPMVLLYDLERVSIGERPDYAGGNDASKTRVLEAAHKLTDTRVSVAVPKRTQKAPPWLAVGLSAAVGVVALVAGILIGGALSSAGTQLEQAQILATHEAALKSAMVSAVVGKYEDARAALDRLRGRADAAETDLLKKLVDRSELIHKARQAGLDGKQEEAFDLYQSALEIDNDPAVMAYLQELATHSAIP